MTSFFSSGARAVVLSILCCASAAPGCVSEEATDISLCQSAAEHVAACTGETRTVNQCHRPSAERLLQATCEDIRGGKGDLQGYFDRLWCHLFGDFRACERIFRIDDAILVDDADGAPAFSTVGEWTTVRDRAAVGGSYHLHTPERECRVRSVALVNERCFSARWDPQIGESGAGRRGYYLIRLYYPPSADLNPGVFYTLLERDGLVGGNSHRVSQREAYSANGWTYWGPVFIGDGHILRASVFTRDDLPSPSPAPVVADAVEFIPVPHLLNW